MDLTIERGKAPPARRSATKAQLRRNEGAVDAAVAALVVRTGGHFEAVRDQSAAKLREDFLVALDIFKREGGRV